MSEIRLCKKEHQILSYIYQLRTLSFHQIFHYLFLPDGCSESYCSKLLKTLVSTGLITKQGFYKTDCYYFITTKGISCLKTMGSFLLEKKIISLIIQIGIWSHQRSKWKKRLSLTNYLWITLPSPSVIITHLILLIMMKNLSPKFFQIFDQMEL